MLKVRDPTVMASVGQQRDYVSDKQKRLSALHSHQHSTTTRQLTLHSTSIYLQQGKVIIAMIKISLFLIERMFDPLVGIVGRAVVVDKGAVGWIAGGNDCGCEVLQ